MVKPDQFCKDLLNDNRLMSIQHAMDIMEVMHIDHNRVWPVILLVH